MISRQSSCFLLLSPAVPDQYHKNERRKTLTAQNFCRFFEILKKMSENQTPMTILDQTRKVHQKNLDDKSSEEVKRQK